MAQCLGGSFGREKDRGISSEARHRHDEGETIHWQDSFASATVISSYSRVMCIYHSKGPQCCCSVLICSFLYSHILGSRAEEVEQWTSEEETDKEEVESEQSPEPAFGRCSQGLRVTLTIKVSLFNKYDCVFHPSMHFMFLFGDSSKNH